MQNIRGSELPKVLFALWIGNLHAQGTLFTFAIDASNGKENEMLIDTTNNILARACAQNNSNIVVFFIDMNDLLVTLNASSSINPSNP